VETTRPKGACLAVLDLSAAMLTMRRMNHAGKFEPNSYYGAHKWGEVAANSVDDLLKFTLTDEQKKQISGAMANWYCDIVQDERNDICAELQQEAEKAHDSTVRSVYMSIVQSLKLRGRE
jgi:hypothetical protein